MPVTVCFDALGTCFGTDVLVETLEKLMGDRLRAAGSDVRMTIMDWFHSAQRDYTYLSITSPPPPPIAQILKLTLQRSITFALASTPSLSPSEIDLPDLSPVLDKLTSLKPTSGLEECFRSLKGAGANVLIITNGSKATTEGYVSQAGLEGLVDEVRSCDEVGLAKPHKEVYEGALEACEQVERKSSQSGGSGNDGGGGGSQRWFVAAHMWDLAAARKAGFKTGAVLSEQPPLGDQLSKWYDLYGGEPDVTGKDLAEVAKKILAMEKQRN